jgi:sugar/nucleoside kinase (ribokinase family)
VDEVGNVNARAFIIGASARGEVPTEVVDALAATGALIALDVQGFLRVAREGMLIADGWPEKVAVLPKVSVLKTDEVEAQLLTGEPDRRAAARRLAAYGASEVLITHSGGVLVHHDGVIHQAPLMPRVVRGRSGRGDTCTAAYVARRLTSPPHDALAWAAAITSLKLEAEGPYRRETSEVESLYTRIRELITSP